MTAGCWQSDGRLRAPAASSCTLLLQVVLQGAGSVFSTACKSRLVPLCEPHLMWQVPTHARPDPRQAQQHAHDHVSIQVCTAAFLGLGAGLHTCSTASGSQSRSKPSPKVCVVSCTRPAGLAPSCGGSSAGCCADACGCWRRWGGSSGGTKRWPLRREGSGDAELQATGSMTDKASPKVALRR